MLRFNTFRAKRYLRSKFVEGKYLLASEATDLELEILDLLRQSTRDILGENIAIEDAWKVEKLSDTELLIKPGQAWFKGIPYQFRGGKDQLVSGAILSLGTVPVGVSVSDDSNGLGKILEFNDGATTPTNTYRIVITATEQLLTDVDDPFLKNVNLTESTAQKIRLRFQINIVPESLQTESPLPYRDEASTAGAPTNFPNAGGTASPNFVNQIVVTPTAAGNGEQVALNLISGSEGIDGRDLELVLRNDPGIGGGNPFPNSVNAQAAFANGRLIDSNGNSYYVNAVFNDTVSTQVVIRIDKEPGQLNPQIINTKPFTLLKREPFVTDDINGSPQGKSHWPIATISWHSTNGFVHQSSVTDLRTRVAKQDAIQKIHNQRLDLRLTDGGNITWNSSTQSVNWTSPFSIINPHGLVQTIAANNARVVDGGCLAYEMNLETGGARGFGTVAMSVVTAGATSQLAAADYSAIKVGNIVVDSGGVVAQITAIDDVNNTITTSPALSNNGAGTIYRDSYGPGTVPVTDNTFILACRKGAKIYVGGLELETGETSQIGDGASAQLLTFIGSTGDADSSPQYVNNYAVTDGSPLNSAISDLSASQQAQGTFMGAASALDIAPAYSSNNYIVDGQPLTTAISALDAAISAVSGAVRWKEPVANFAALPALGNADGDVRLTLDTRTAYSWFTTGAVWVEIGHWKKSVANFAALPLVNNMDGDVKITLDTRIAYSWHSATTEWIPLNGTGGGQKLIGGGTLTNSPAGSQSTASNATGGAQFTLTNVNEWGGQSFTPTITGTVEDITFSIRYNTSAPSGNFFLRIYSDNGSGVNSGTILATSDNVNSSVLTTSFADITFPFSSPIVLNSGTKYHAILITSGITYGGGEIALQSNAGNPYAGGTTSATIDAGANWGIQGGTIDLVFNVDILGGTPTLVFTDDMFLEIKGLDYSDNTINSSESPLQFSNDLDVAYILPNFTTGGPSLTVTIDSLDQVPANATVIARRVGSDIIVGSSSTRLSPGQSTELYAQESIQTRNTIRSTDFLRSNNPVTWTGSQLQFTTDIVLESLNTRTGATKLSTILAASSPLTLADGELAYVVINRGTGSSSVSLVVSSTVPTVTEQDDEYIVIARRRDALGEAYLHIPLHKQVLDPGQTTRLGASGSGNASIKATFLDPISTVLPTGTSVTIDGISGVNGDLVLYTNLTTNNNRIYELSGVGTAIVWTATRAFDGDFDPTDGDSVRIASGTSFSEQLAIFDGSDFKVNDVVRFFDGVSSNYWELGSIKTVQLTDNTSNGIVFSVTVPGSENWIVNYSISRGAGLKDTGQLFITSDGTDVALTNTNAYLGDTGVEFDSDINAGNIRLLYTTTNTGTDATMKLFVMRWSNSSGGPSGVPNYGTAPTSSTAAAGALGDVQYKGATGNLTGDTDFKWDDTENAINLNGLLIKALQGPVTLLDNQTNQTIFSYDVINKYAIIEYSILRNTDTQVGRLLVTTNGSSTSLSDDNTFIGTPGVTFSAAISGSNILIRYTTSSNGFDASFKYSFRRWT